VADVGVLSKTPAIVPDFLADSCSGFKAVAGDVGPNLFDVLTSLWSEPEASSPSQAPQFALFLLKLDEEVLTIDTLAAL